MLSDAERTVLDHLRQARESISFDGGDPQGDLMVIKTAIQQAERLVYSAAGRRDADNDVQAKYLEDRVIELAGAVDRAEVESIKAALDAIDGLKESETDQLLEKGRQ